MNKANLPTDGFCIKVDMNDPLFLKCKQLLEESYKWSIHYTDNGLVSKYMGITNEGILFSLRKPNLYSKNKDNENIFTSYEFLEIVGESGEDSRDVINKKISDNTDKMKSLAKENQELHRKQLLISDSKQWFKEEPETRGRGKNKKTELIGRIYFYQTFTYENTGESFDILLSRVVRIDGEWQE